MFCSGLGVGFIFNLFKTKTTEYNVNPDKLCFKYLGCRDQGVNDYQLKTLYGCMFKDFWLTVYISAIKTNVFTLDLLSTAWLFRFFFFQGML